MGPVENDFNPGEYAPEYVVVGVSDDMPSILSRIEDAWTRTPNAVLIIPRDTQVFHNTQDFLAIGKLQGAREVRISLASLDPTILGLGRLLGFHVLDPAPDHPALANDPALGNSSLDGDVEQPTAPLRISEAGDVDPNLPGWVLTPSTPTYPPASTTTSAWLNYPGDASPYVEAPRQPWVDPGSSPAQHAGVPAPRTRPRQTRQLGPPVISGGTGLSMPEGIPRSQPAVSSTPAGRIKARRVVPAYENGRRFRYGGRVKPAGWGKLLTVLASLLVVILVGGSAYAYVYLPEGTVSVTPLNQVRDGINIEVSVMTGTSTQPGDKSGTTGQMDTTTPQTQTARSLNAGTISATLQEEGTRPAGGTRQVPRGKAQGLMRFTNRTGGSVSVARGTQFKASNGVVVQTTQAGTVPPTVFGQTFGTLDLPIASTVEGPDGNIAAGQIAGIYGGTLNYTNLSTLQGGTLETVKVVTQADIDSLVADLRAGIEGRKAGAMLDMTPAGHQLITQTIELAGSQFQTDRKANQDGDTVTAKLTATVRARVFKLSELHDSIAQAVTDSIQSSIPRAVGPNLDMGSIEYSDPVLKSVEPGRVVYTTTAKGRVSFTLTTELARQIRDLVRGKDISQARSLINQNFSAYITPDSIQARVLWFTLDKLPSNPAHITVQSTTSSQP
jgi:hypothetical protein